MRPIWPAPRGARLHRTSSYWANAREMRLRLRNRGGATARLPSYCAKTKHITDSVREAGAIDKQAVSGGMFSADFRPSPARAPRQKIAARTDLTTERPVAAEPIDRTLRRAKTISRPGRTAKSGSGPFFGATTLNPPQPSTENMDLTPSLGTLQFSCISRPGGLADRSKGRCCQNATARCSLVLERDAAQPPRECFADQVIELERRGFRREPLRPDVRHAIAPGIRATRAGRIVDKIRPKAVGRAEARSFANQDDRHACGEQLADLIFDRHPPARRARPAPGCGPRHATAATTPSGAARRVDAPPKRKVRPTQRWRGQQVSPHRLHFRPPRSTGSPRSRIAAGGCLRRAGDPDRAA